MRGGAEAQARVLARRGDEREDVALDGRGRVDRARDLGEPQHVRTGGHGPQVRERVVRLLAVEHAQLGVDVRVPHGEACHEAVALGLRGGRCPPSRPGSGSRRRGTGSGACGSCRRPSSGPPPCTPGAPTGSWGGAVDLVADDDVGEDGARAELELVVRRAVDVDAGEVARQEVGRELDAADLAVDRASQGLGERGLADTGDVLDEEVPLRQEDGDGDGHEVGPPGDHGLDAGADPSGRLDQLVETGEVSCAGLVGGRDRGDVGEHGDLRRRWRRGRGPARPRVGRA